jgi:hypothetical protein
MALSEKVEKLELSLNIRYDDGTEPIDLFLTQLATEERRYMGDRCYTQSLFLAIVTTFCPKYWRF